MAAGGAGGGLPASVSRSPRDAEASGEVQAAPRSLRRRHLRLALSDADEAVNRTGIDALPAAAYTRLRLDLSIDDAAQARVALDALSAALATAHVGPESIADFRSGALSIAAAGQAFPGSAVGGGSADCFVQLNRLEGLGGVLCVSFTTSPGVHGADDSAVMPRLQSLPSMLQTEARKPQRPIRAGPSTTALRRSPMGKQPQVDGTRRIAPAAQGPRCQGLYGAAWTLAYVAQHGPCRWRRSALTLMSLHGPSGIGAVGARRAPGDAPRPLRFRPTRRGGTHLQRGRLRPPACRRAGAGPRGQGRVFARPADGRTGRRPPRRRGGIGLRR